MSKDKQFIQAKADVIENLEAIQLVLNQCEDQGMVDFESAYYNEIADLIQGVHIGKTWDELMEVISKAKILETDIDGWLSFHGRTSVSLSWPSAP